MNVSLVITVLNEAASLPALLGSIAAQTRLPDEVVVVDGGSVDGTWQLLDNYAGPLVLKAFRHPGSNIAQGRNRAIEEAVGDVVAVTDGGVHLVAEWLEALLRPLEAAPGVQAVAGFFLADPHSAFEVAMGATVLPTLDDITPKTFLPSSRSVAFRKSLWQAVGGYPEWLDYCEDVVFDFSILTAGQRFAWAPKAVAYFRPRASLRAFFLQYYRYARGDGKARLWPGRHLARYSAYAFAAAVLVFGARWPWLWALIAAGGAWHLRRPYQRLFGQWAGLDAPQKAFTLACVPVIKLVGDGAKMLGYPVGLLWRGRSRSE